MTTQKEQTSIFEWIWSELIKIFPFLTSVTKKVANIANDIVNEIKALDKPTFAAIEAIVAKTIEALDPALTPLVEGLMLELQKIFAFTLNLPTSTNSDILAAKYVQHLNSSADVSTLLYANTAGTLSSIIQGYLLNNTGVKHTEAQLIVSAQISHLQSK